MARFEYKFRNYIPPWVQSKTPSCGLFGIRIDNNMNAEGLKLKSEPIQIDICGDCKKYLADYLNGTWPDFLTDRTSGI